LLSSFPPPPNADTSMIVLGMSTNYLCTLAIILTAANVLWNNSYMSCFA
jgi:hypothetical protein